MTLSICLNVKYLDPSVEASSNQGLCKGMLFVDEGYR